MAAAVRVVLDAAALARLLESPQGDVGKEILRRTIKVERAAKQGCPVDTGRLRSSIAYRIEGGNEVVGIVGTSVEYAPFVEFGTRFMAAQPFLRPALQAASS